MTDGDVSRRDDSADRIRSYLLAEHGDLVEDVANAADAVAARWSSGKTGDRDAVVGPLENELERRGLVDRFPAVLADVVTAAGFELQAPPVAGPPYVVVTSTGPVLRATVSAGRIVISLRVFEVERDPVCYCRNPAGAERALSVSFVDER